MIWLPCCPLFSPQIVGVESEVASCNLKNITQIYKLQMTSNFLCCKLTTLAINVSVHVPPFVSKESVRDLIVLNISKSNRREHILSKDIIKPYCYWKIILWLKLFYHLKVETTWSYFLNVKSTCLYIINNFSDICYVFFHNGITIWFNKNTTYSKPKLVWKKYFSN